MINQCGVEGNQSPSRNILLLALPLMCTSFRQGPPSPKGHSLTTCSLYKLVIQPAFITVGFSIPSAIKTGKCLIFLPLLPPPPPGIKGAESLSQGRLS
ncbi:hypothetical protein XENTR_v10013841 [Xenopus tropicalis]|nr:hypothetical protein XENTR_v10013841 [Xenopus tropicalis]